MKKRHFLFLLIVLAATVPAFAQDTFADLFAKKQYFTLRDRLALEKNANAPELLFYRGIVANRFNQLAESDRLLEKYLATKNPAHIKDTYEALADSYVRTFQYSKAADVFKLLLTKHKDGLTPDEVKDYMNLSGLWGPLRNAPKQETIFNGPFAITGKRDKANLLNLPVEVAGQTMDFVFDTGANISTMTVSTANKFGLKIIETSVSVGSSSDIKVNSKLAVAPELKIGTVTFRNVIFLVLEDKALTFPQADYHIDGIIGFPMIESLGVVKISKNNEVSKSPKGLILNSEPNMCLESLKPLVTGTIDGRKLMFSFDSGAVSTTFYPPFFNDNKEMIVRTGQPKKTKLGGAGGYKEMDAYYLKDLSLSIGGKTAVLGSAEIITEAVNDDSKDFYGNLGQDIIKQFDSMTLDFRGMRLIFE